MTRVVYQGKRFEICESETLLDGLLAQGAEVQFGCKTGACQSCLLKCLEGEIPAAAQKGLRESQVLTHHLLACQCHPLAPMTLVPPNTEGQQVAARVTGLRRLNDQIMEVALEPDSALPYRAGQFLRLYHPNGQSRCYSLASVPGLDAALVLHVREYPNGLLSHWVHHELTAGQRVSLSEPSGECFFIPTHPDQPLLLIGTGSGLAPLYGIARDALAQSHQGPIYLYHGARIARDLYLEDELNRLMAQRPRFHYQPCISGEADLPILPLQRGRASDLAFSEHPDLTGWRVYLCGNSAMVQTAQMQAFLAGAPLKDIHVDAFVPQGVTSQSAGS